jgi:hypothetical protein
LPDIQDADVAQLVEQLIRNQQVSGSIPLIGSTYHLDLFFIPHISIILAEFAYFPFNSFCLILLTLQQQF